MERIIFFICLCAVSEGDIGKYILERNGRSWLEALDYCKQHHTDLSFICNQRDQDKLQGAPGGPVNDAWIGLQLNPSNLTSWEWSAGGHMTYTNWGFGQPKGTGATKVHTKLNGKWHDDPGNEKIPFYCINVTVVEDKKTWEGALKHCRDRGTDLISMHCETDRIVARRVIQEANSRERVWIGLRFLEDSWLWVNDNPLDYEAWPKGDRHHQCPLWKRCGALTKDGLWENWNCSERLNFICN